MIREMKLFWQRTHWLLVFLFLLLIMMISIVWLDHDKLLSDEVTVNALSGLKIALAAVMGSLIGQERSHKNRPAGLRTHALVCMGAAVVMVIPIHLSMTDSIPQMDVTRLGAQVISGIGFLGAGTIIRNGSNVKGLTTAATLWVVAIIGLTIGSGLFAIATLSMIIGLMVLRVDDADDEAELDGYRRV